MKKITRGFALLLTTALLHASFGPEAWAQIVPISGVTAPVGGSASASVTGNASVGQQNGAPAFSVSLTQTGSALPLGPGFGSLGIGPSAIVSAASGSPIAAAASRSSVVTAKTAAAIPSAAAIVTAAARLTPNGALLSAADETPSEKPAAETKAAAPAKTGLAAIVAAKTTASLDALKRFFGNKRAESTPVASEADGWTVIAGPTNKLSAANSELLPSGQDGTDGDNGDAVVPPAPPTPPTGPNNDGNKGKGKGWFGLGAIVATLIGGMLVMQLGLEAQGAAMAKLTEDAFGDFSILAQVAIFSQIGSMIGQQLAQFFSAKFGLTKTFYAAQTLRAVSLGAMVLLLGTGMMPLPLMFVFYALNGVMTGVSATAEGTLRKFILAEQGVSQQKFRTWWQLLAEIIAVPAPMVFGALVGTLGAGWITAIYPAAIVVGLLIFLMFKVMPISAANRVEARLTAAPEQKPAQEPAPKGGMWTRFKAALSQIASNMQGGMQFVMSSSVLKFSMIAAVIFDLMNLMIYRLIAPGYAKLVAGVDGMAAMAGNLVGMFSLGGLLLAMTFLVLERRAKKKNEGKTDEQKAASERSSVLRWTMAGIPALGLLGLMAFQLALPLPELNFMDVNWMPGSVLAAALIPFGFFQVAASIKLNSYFYDKLPDDPVKVQKAIAFSGSAMTAMSIVLMLLLKPLFGDLGAFNPFPWLAGSLIPVAAAVFFARKRLAQASAPGAEEKEGDAPSPALSGGFVGLLLGVIAAAIVAVTLPMIPGLGAAIAGMGVLGKFLLQAGIAAVLPTAGFFLDKFLRNRAANKKK